MEYALRTFELTKKYGEKLAVNNVNINIPKGEVYGFVGKNGAGKTTLIRLVLGLANPTSGNFEFFGGMNNYKARARIGNLIESPAIYPNMTGQQNLTIFCKMLGVNEEKIPELLNLVGLNDVGKKKAKDYSLGMKQRLGIAIALLGDPEFLILDEPINGLDPSGIIEVRDLIIKLNKEFGKTVLISSHILGELSKLSTCYGIISNGMLVEELTHEELISRCTATTVIKTNNPEKAKQIISNLLADKYGTVPTLSINNNGAVVIGSAIEDTGSVTKALFMNDVVVESLTTAGSDLENYFVERMG